MCTEKEKLEKTNNFLIFGSNLMCNIAINWILQAGHFDICFKTVQPVFCKFFAINKMRNFFFLQITFKILVAQICNIHQLIGLFKPVILICITKLCDLCFANYSKFKKCAKNATTLWWQKSEKNRFLCVIPQKKRLEKCR